MSEYEIRLLSPRMAPHSSTPKQFSDDDEAIDAAKKQAMGQGLEVWRDGVCIFRAPPDDAHKNWDPTSAS